MASEEPMALVEPAVTGMIVLPEGAVLPSTADWSVQLQDTSLVDAPAVVLGEDAGIVSDSTATEIPFEIAYDSADIDERDTYTLSARIEDAEGNLLFINDTSIPVVTSDAPSEDVVVEVIDVQAQAAAAEALMTEAEESAAP